MRLVFVRFLQAWLLCTSHGHPSPDDDLFLLSNSELDFSIPATIIGDNIDLFADPDILTLADENSVSTFLPSSGFDSGSNLFDQSIGESLSLDEIALASGDWSIADDSNFNLMDLVATHPSCVSDEGPLFGGIARRGETCVDITRFQGPSSEVEKPPDTANNVFPPPGSNKKRLPGPENDPKPRPSTEVANSPFDFEYCGSGFDGWRQYAVCDSGFENDRTLMRYSPIFHALFHCTRRK